MNSDSHRADFSLLKAAGMAALGGGLYGGVYTGARALLQGKETRLTPGEVGREALANSAGGMASGIGIYAATKLPELLRRMKR